MIENKTTQELEMELLSLRKELQNAEYDLRWDGYTHPVDYMRSERYDVVSNLRRRESELQREISHRVVYH